MSATVEYFPADVIDGQAVEAFVIVEAKNGNYVYLSVSDLEQLVGDGRRLLDGIAAVGA